MRNELCTLTPDMVGGDQEVFYFIKRQLQEAIRFLELRFRWLKTVPWLFANATEKETAIDIL